MDLSLSVWLSGESGGAGALRWRSRSAFRFFFFNGGFLKK
jgi:hypothetical protein